jgi:hypothetical protein
MEWPAQLEHDVASARRPTGEHLWKGTVMTLQALVIVGMLVVVVVLALAAVAGALLSPKRRAARRARALEAAEQAER